MESLVLLLILVSTSLLTSEEPSSSHWGSIDVPTGALNFLGSREKAILTCVCEDGRLKSVVVEGSDRLRPRVLVLSEAVHRAAHKNSAKPILSAESGDCDVYGKPFIYQCGVRS